MAQELTQVDFDVFLPKRVDLRPKVAEQVRRYLASNDYAGTTDTDIAKAEKFLRKVERKGYAKKQRKSDERPVENSAPYRAMLINWGRKVKGPDGEQAAPEGDREFARGVFYYFFRDVAHHVYFSEVAKEVWQPNELIFQRFYYAKYCDDPKRSNFSEVCARFRANDGVVRKEFKKIWVGAPIGSPTKVYLGPVTIVLGHEDNLNQLSLQEPINQNYVTDGMPDVFKALDWRSRLSAFCGRDADASLLDDWARDESHKPKFMLITGPGGAGKTRLAADVVAQLVHKHGWNGGFLGDVNRPIDGNGAGVALIIDYPEERTTLVTEILKAAAQSSQNNESYDRPVRLILVSRETREAWAKILNEPVNFVDETRLDARPYLKLKDARAIAEDIAQEYPVRLGRAACEFSGVESWLENPVHRLPLNIVAAAVHAVLDPGRAFELDSAEVLIALAEWELRRVRYYSERDLGDRNALEKLVALSLFTQLGLTKETVFELGEKGICFNKSGDGLLDAVRTTPFWRSKTADDPSHLQRLEPDRLAAAFFLLALRLTDPSPALPAWLISPASQDVDGFGERLSRVAFDTGHVDPEASRILEQQCIAMLDLQPALISQFKGIAYRESPVFSALFASEICERLLGIVTDIESRASLLNNKATMLQTLGELEAALEAIAHSIALRRQLGSYDILPNLAIVDFHPELSRVGA